MLVLGALPSLTHAECNNPGDYIMLDFNTSLVRSNLGGQGGRCTELGACDELQTTSTPHELYFRDIAISYDKLTGSASKLGIDLRVTNTTEYRAWNPNLNGIKRRSGGAFGSINLLGPRHHTQPRFWRAAMTHAVLKFEFLDTTTGQPVNLPLTYLSFFDLDTSPGGSDRECLRASHIQNYFLSPNSALEVYSTPQALLQQGLDIDGLPPNSLWNSVPAICAAAPGVGEDNPVEPYALTPFQKRHAVLLQLASVTSFELLFSVDAFATASVAATTHSSLRRRDSRSLHQRVQPLWFVRVWSCGGIGRRVQ